MPMSPRLLRPRASGAFTPRRIAGLAAWYDAADATTLTIATGVSAWADKSDNNLTLTQGVGNNQPISATRTIGGKNALDFNGSSSALLTDFNIGAFTTSRAFTAFAVVASDNMSAAFSPWVWVDRTNAGDSSGFLLARRTIRPEFAIGTGALTAGTSVGSGVAYRRFDDNSTAAAIYSVSAGASSGLTAMYKNNTSQSLSLWFGSMATSAFLGTGTSNHRLVVGAGSVAQGTDVLDFFHDGLIGEILIYSTELTAPQLTAVNRYLGNKWGITVA